MVLYEIYSGKSEWTNMYVHPMYLLILNKRIQYIEVQHLPLVNKLLTPPFIHVFYKEEIHLYFSISLKCLARSVAAFG